MTGLPGNACENCMNTGWENGVEGGCEGCSFTGVQADGFTACPCTEETDHARNLCSWVEAALQCKTWNWDGDQFEAALFVVNQYRASIELPPFQHGRD